MENPPTPPTPPTPPPPTMTTTFNNATGGWGTLADGRNNVYPVNLVVTNAGTAITAVTFTLTNLVLGTTFPKLQFLLVSPTGKMVMLCNHPSGPPALNTIFGPIVLKLDDAAAFPIPAGAAPLTAGTYRPATYGAEPNLPAPAPAGPYLHTMAGFNGDSPNGTWQLYAACANGFPNNLGTIQFDQISITITATV